MVVPIRTRRPPTLVGKDEPSGPILFRPGDANRSSFSSLAC